MVTALNARHTLYRAPATIADPGSGGTITIDRDGAVCPVVTTTAEARTLRRPTKAGINGTVVLKTDGGDLTLTVTGGFNNDADTSITFDDAGDYVRFTSIEFGGAYYWRIVSQEGTNVSGETLSVDSFTATNANATTAIITNATLGRMQVTQTAVNAAGTNIANAGALSYGVNVVAGADNTVGVILPVAVANAVVEVFTTVNAKQLAIYPQVNSSIAGLTANVAFNTGVANTAAQAGTTQNSYFKFIATNTTQWYVSK